MKVNNKIKGFSLVEFVVSILLLGLVVAGIGYTMSLGNSNYIKVTEQQTLQSELQLAKLQFSNREWVLREVGVLDNDGNIVNSDLHSCFRGDHSSCTGHAKQQIEIPDSSRSFGINGRCNFGRHCQTTLRVHYSIQCQEDKCTDVVMGADILSWNKDNPNQPILKKTIKRNYSSQLLFGEALLKVDCTSVESINYRDRSAVCGGGAGSHTLATFSSDALSPGEQKQFYALNSCGAGFSALGAGMNCVSK